MRVRFSLRWQIALVVGLFAASLLILLSVSVAVLLMPARRAQEQRRLTEASHRMAEAAAVLLSKLPAEMPSQPPPDWPQRLADITFRVLSHYPGVEGGYYLAGPWGQFTGHAFPIDLHPPPPPPQSPAKPPPPSMEPPPREKDFIAPQCQASLSAEPGAAATGEFNIPPSRILVVTEPVGQPRPALMATWVMTRLTSPEHLAEQTRRYQVAAGLALFGILMALLLTANLGRNLSRERQQREQLGEELRRAEHFAALGKLLAGVAHEVRNPLAAIRSTVQLYQRLPETRRDPSALDTILHGVDRLNALVSRLLFFMRSGHEERRPVDVNAIVRETISLLHAQADSQHVALQTELASDLPPLLGSMQALQQVVLNLMTNALQAMPDGGTLRCRTRWLEGPPRIELSIADTGPGIAAAELPHLFEPFHTTRPEGTGLGLALCREIVQQHGGRIELERQEGWGAVFRVTLPFEPV
jgi:two-component system, NtrC family, sensor histidine kinase HydH